MTAVLAGGCASPRDRPLATLEPVAGFNAQALAQARQTLDHLYPPQYRAVQRAVITVGKRQFVCDGLLAVSPTEGHRLGLVSNLGVVAEVRLRPDGLGEVMKVTPLLRAAWSHDYVLRDLRWLFAAPATIASEGWRADGRLVLQTPAEEHGQVARYVFDAEGRRLEAVELSGRGRCFYRAAVKRYQTLAGHAIPVPAEFDVDAGSYRLHLRNVQMVVETRSSSAPTEVRP